MDNLNSIINLDGSARAKKFKKGDVLQRSGEISSLAFFVKKGLLRSYTIDNKGKEHIFMFASEGWIVGDIESQEFDQPTKLFIESLEESEVIVFDRKCFRVANLTTDQLRENANLMARRIGVLQNRVLMLMSASAKERYDSFLETYPKLLNRVPQRMIASYLGITPQALSTIRGEFTRKKSN